jgi:hypothetical protein
VISPKRAVERCERLAALGPPPPQRHNRKLKRWLDAFSSIMALDISECAEMLREIYSSEYLSARAARPAAFATLSKSSVAIDGSIEWVQPVVVRKEEC